MSVEPNGIPERAGDREACSRRELFTSAARWVLLAGLVGGAFALVRRGAPASSEACGACQGCPALAGCRRPQALEAQQAGEGGADHAR
jgi:hypothetical protein